MGWPAYSLPTPDSLSAHKYGVGVSPSVASQAKKEESPEYDTSSKQTVAASEKRRRRRESHNAVERRRRDNINEKISELATLIPECMLDPGSSGTPTTAKDLGMEVFNAATQNGDDGDGKEPPVIKANKGMILRKSVDYIRYLQQLVTAQASRNRDLESQISRLAHQSVGSVDSSSSALTPEGPTLDLSQQNFHVFGDELLNGVNAMGIDVDILHTLTPQEGEDYLSLLGHGHGSGGEKVPASDTTAEAGREDGATRDLEMDDGSEGTGTSADSPLARGSGEGERGRSREWSRMSADAEMVKEGAPVSSATHVEEEKVAVKEEESPMMVV